MTLQEQIEATIQAYQEACKPENLNIDYCNNNNLYKGICKFLECNEYYDFKIFISPLINKAYLTYTPTTITYNTQFLFYNKIDIQCNSIIEAHQIRISFLQKILRIYAKSLNPIINP